MHFSKLISYIAKLGIEETFFNSDLYKKNIFSLPPTLSRSRTFNNVCDFNLICANVINFFHLFHFQPLLSYIRMIFLPFTLGRKENPRTRTEIHGWGKEKKRPYKKIKFSILLFPSMPKAVRHFHPVCTHNRIFACVFEHVYNFLFASAPVFRSSFYI